MTEIIFVVEDAPEGGTWPELSENRSSPGRSPFPSCTSGYGTQCSAISTAEWDRN